MNASELKKGNFIRHMNDIWRITRKEVAAVGTHSHTKIKLFARPMHGGGEKSFIFAHHDKVEGLDIIRKSAQVIAINPQIQIMDNVSYQTLDANCSDEIKNELSEGDLVIYVDIEGEVEILEKG